MRMPPNTDIWLAVRGCCKTIPQSGTKDAYMMSKGDIDITLSSA